MIDVEIGEPCQARGHEVHERFERLPLLGAAVRPERPEAALALVPEDDPEEVLEPAFLQRIALHVEEDVALVRRREARQAAPGLRCRRQDLVPALLRLPLSELKGRLLAEPLERLGLDSLDARAGGRLRQRGKGRDARLGQPLDLRPADVRDLHEVIVREPLRFAPVPPVADRTALARVGVGGPLRRVDVREEARLQRRVVVGVVGDPERALLAVAEDEVRHRRRCSLRGGEQIGIEDELEQRARLRGAGELGVHHLVAVVAEGGGT